MYVSFVENSLFASMITTGIPFTNSVKSGLEFLGVPLYSASGAYTKLLFSKFL